AERVMRAEAARLGAPLEVYRLDFQGERLSDGRFRYRDSAKEQIYPRLALLGPHQAINAALALRAAELLPAQLRPAEAARTRGLDEVRWPGRLEWLTPDVLVDTAHNPEGACALAAALPTLLSDRPMTLIFGTLAEKDAAAMVGALAPLAGRVIFTQP